MTNRNKKLENEKDSIELAVDSLYFIESSDNYSTVFYEKNQKLQKTKNQIKQIHQTKQKIL